MKLIDFKKKFILDALVRNKFSRAKTAEELGISSRSLSNYISEWWPEHKRRQSTLNIPKRRNKWNSQDSW